MIGDVGDGAPHVEPLALQPGGLRRDRVGIDVDQRHPRAVRRQHLAVREPEPTGTAGDDRRRTRPRRTATKRSLRPSCALVDGSSLTGRREARLARPSHLAVGGGAAVLLVRHVVAPDGGLVPSSSTWSIARWVMKRLGAAPCQCSSPARRRRGRRGGSPRSGRRAAARADALDDVDRLAVRMGVPGGAGAGREVDAARAQPRCVRRRGDRVDVDPPVNQSSARLCVDAVPRDLHG